MSTRSLKLEALAGLIERDGADPKPTMLRVLTDFYVQKALHTPEEDRHFTELALRLIGDVDAATRADVAHRLTIHGAAPAIVLRRLTDRDTADPDMDRADVVRMSSAESDILRFTLPEPATPSPAAPHAATGDIADRAAAANFSDRFFTSDSTGRRAMLRELDGGAVRLSSIKADAAAAACRELEGAALRSRPYEFVREMERALGMPRIVAQQIVNDASGEPMLVVAKALQMPVDVLQRILLLVNPAVGTSVRRVFDLTELYQAMSEQSALRMIALWRYVGEPAGFSASPTREAVRRTGTDTLRPSTASVQSETAKRDQRAS